MANRARPSNKVACLILNVVVKVLPVSLSLYALALMSSMAGMEIFGWLSGALALLALIAVGLGGQADDNDGSGDLAAPIVDGSEHSFSHFSWMPVDKILLALFVVIALGAAVNGPGFTPYIDIIGSARFIFLFILIRHSLFMTWNSRRVQKVVIPLMVLGGVIGAYCIVQHFTGLDLIRNSDRAVQPLTMGSAAGSIQLYRAAGLLNSPMTFAQSFGLFLCFPFAFLIVGFAQEKRHQIGLILIATLMSIGLFLSMTRGAWVAAFVAICFMASLLSMKYVVRAVVVFVLVAGTAVAVSPIARSRLDSLFSVSTFAHFDRFKIWSAHWEIAKDFPILGVGYGENEPLSESYYDRLGIVDGQVGHAHNTYLQFLAGTGIVGLLLYLAFIGYFFYLSMKLWGKIPKTLRFERGLVLGAIGAQVFLHIGGLVECNFKDAEVNHPFMFILAMVAALSLRALETEHLLDGVPLAVYRTGAKT